MNNFFISKNCLSREVFYSYHIQYYGDSNGFRWNGFDFQVQSHTENFQSSKRPQEGKLAGRWKLQDRYLSFD